MSDMIVQPLDDNFKTWAFTLIDREWGPPGIVTRGKLHETTKLSGFVAAVCFRKYPALASC